MQRSIVFCNTFFEIKGGIHINSLHLTLTVWALIEKKNMRWQVGGHLHTIAQFRHTFYQFQAIAITVSSSHVFANILLSLPFCKTISISSLDLRVPANLIHVSLAFYLIALFTIVVCTNLYRYVRHNSCMLKAVSRIFPKFITMLVLLDYVLLLLIKCLFGFLDTLQHFPSKKVRSCQADWKGLFFKTVYSKLTISWYSSGFKYPPILMCMIISH